MESLKIPQVKLFSADIKPLMQWVCKIILSRSKKPQRGLGTDK